MLGKTIKLACSLAIHQGPMRPITRPIGMGVLHGCMLVIRVQHGLF